MEKSTYRNYEIIIIENNSTEPETFAYYREIDGKRGVRLYTGRISLITRRSTILAFPLQRENTCLCLNNDITVITPDWMERMLGQCQRKNVGIVGAKLYYRMIRYSMPALSSESAE